MALGLSESAEYLGSPDAHRLDGEKGVPIGLQKGHHPWNAGTKGISSVHPDTTRCHFRKGERRGAANTNYVPIGTERISKDGYLERKVLPAPAPVLLQIIHLIDSLPTPM